MMRRSLLLLTSVFLLHAMTAPAATPQFPDVADTSFTDAHGDRTLQLSLVVAASPKDAFAALEPVTAGKRGRFRSRPAIFVLAVFSKRATVWMRPPEIAATSRRRSSRRYRSAC